MLAAGKSVGLLERADLGAVAIGLVIILRRHRAGGDRDRRNDRAEAVGEERDHRAGAGGGRVCIFLEGQRFVGLRAKQPAAEQRASLERQRGVAGDLPEGTTSNPISSLNRANLLKFSALIMSPICVSPRREIYI